MAPGHASVAEIVQMALCDMTVGSGLGGQVSAAPGAESLDQSVSTFDQAGKLSLWSDCGLPSFPLFHSGIAGARALLNLNRLHG